MKSNILLAALLFWIPSFAQLEVKESPKKLQIGEVKSGVYTIAALTEHYGETDTTYSLMYENAKYQSIHDVQFIWFSYRETVSQLYDIMMKFFSDENKKNKDYKVSIKLGDTDVTLSNYRMMGITSVMVFTKDGYFYLTEKQVNKLFGK